MNLILLFQTQFAIVFAWISIIQVEITRFMASKTFIFFILIALLDNSLKDYDKINGNNASWNLIWIPHHKADSLMLSWVEKKQLHIFQSFIFLFFYQDIIDKQENFSTIHIFLSYH